MKAYIVDENSYLSTPTKTTIKTRTISILKALNLPKTTEVCVTFIDDHTMRTLNKTYRGINKTTDVLSFSQVENIAPEFNTAIAQQKNFTHHIGDIIISIPTAKTLTQKHSLHLAHLLTRLIIHGILHLIGYDHKKSKEKQLMREKEEQLIRLINPD